MIWWIWPVGAAVIGFIGFIALQFYDNGFFGMGPAMGALFMMGSWLLAIGLCVGHCLA